MSGEVMILLGNDVVTVGYDFVCGLEVAEDLDRLVSPPLNDWMMLDHHDSADDTLLSPHSTPRGRHRVIANHQGRLSPGSSSSLALATPRLTVETASEGLVSRESHHHGVRTALQAHCEYSVQTSVISSEQQRSARAVRQNPLPDERSVTRGFYTK